MFTLDVHSRLVFTVDVALPRRSDRGALLGEQDGLRVRRGGGLRTGRVCAAGIVPYLVHEEEYMSIASCAQVLNNSPKTVSGISASLVQHCTYMGANGTRRIRDSRVYAYR